MAKKTKKEIYQPDDIFFKFVMNKTENAKAYVQYIHPEWAERLDLNTMERQEETFLIPNLKSFDADINYRCRLKNSNQNISISFLWENKSVPEKYISIQVGLYLFLAYYKMTKTKGRNLEPIIPLFFYNGKKTWNPKSVYELFQEHPIIEEIKPFLPNFSFLFTDITKVPEEQLLNIEADFFRSAMTAMANRHDFDLLVKKFSIIFGIGNNDEDILIAIGHYVFGIYERQPKDLQKEFPNIDKNVKSKIMTTLDYLRKEGKIEGETKAKQETAIRMHGEGFSVVQIARLLDVEEQFVLGVLKLDKK